MTDPKLTPREPSEAERLAQALTDWKSREVRDLDRLDAAAELRRLAALSESNAIDALNYESRIERLQAENDALRAMHDAAPTVEAQPVAWMDDFGNAFPLAANKGAGSWLDEHKRNWKPLYTHPAAPQPAALPEPDYKAGEKGMLGEDCYSAATVRAYGEACARAALKGEQ
jgi:hypothetical protein